MIKIECVIQYFCEPLPSFMFMFLKVRLSLPGAVTEKLKLAFDFHSFLADTC